MPVELKENVCSHDQYKVGEKRARQTAHGGRGGEGYSGGTKTQNIAAADAHLMGRITSDKTRAAAPPVSHIVETTQGQPLAVDLHSARVRVDVDGVACEILEKRPISTRE